MELIIVGLSSTVIASLLAGVFTYRKTRSDIARNQSEIESLHVATAARVVAMTTERMEVMATEIARLGVKVIELEQKVAAGNRETERLRQKVNDLHGHIDTLEALMRSTGLEFPPRPRTQE